MIESLRERALRRLNLQGASYAALPQAGLGNKLLVWARASVFARLNHLRLFTRSWTHVPIGPLLRREHSKRWYAGGFVDTSTVGWPSRLLDLGLALRVVEPPCEVRSGELRGKLFVFNQVPHWSDYFKDLRPHRDYLREEIAAMLSARARAALSRYSPTIGVHVRMGDFRRLASGDDFAKVGATRTPLRYFRDVIHDLRALAGRNLPVTIFSDGADHELAELLGLEQVHRAPRSHDVAELMGLAKSRIIVCSAGSTFGYWAGFLADAPLILHPDHIHAPIRPSEVNAQWYEGPMPTAGSELERLRDNLSELRLPAAPQPAARR